MCPLNQADQAVLTKQCAIATMADYDRPALFVHSRETFLLLQTWILNKASSELLQDSSQEGSHQTAHFCLTSYT